MVHYMFKNNSLNDEIQHLERGNMLRIRDDWKISEIPYTEEMPVEKLDDTCYAK